MNQDLGLRILSQIMQWSDERARQEFEWLRLMARWKYDGYSDFLAGVRFIESLAAWLQQFSPEERETAYRFVRNGIVYISLPEIHHLVNLFYPRDVERRLLDIIAAKLGIQKYRIWALPEARAEFERLRRKTLFMALSDGARIDALRHANVGILTNEQLVIATQVDTEKWEDLLDNLRGELNDPGAQFALVYLIDDFIGTGTSFIRYDDEKQEWKGKMMRFLKSVQQVANAGNAPFEKSYTVCVHYYIASHRAASTISEQVNKAKATLVPEEAFSEVHFSFGMVLPHTLPVDSDEVGNAEFIKLTKKYYDPKLRTKHTDVGGVTHLGLGYGGCALPVVLEHNTPNNSISLLWAETDGGMRDGGLVAPAMRPLFRRRQRFWEGFIQ